MTKPRAKRGVKDVELQSYLDLQNYDALSDRVMGKMLAGGMGLAKSSVSQAFVRANKGALDEVNSRDFGCYDFVCVMVDGVGFGDRTVIAALGITTKGEKLILGLREGETENWEVAKDLFESLAARGLKIDQKMLFAIDGSKALRKAITKIFGNVAVQRCVRQKERNMISYLPADRHLEFRRRWKKIHTMNDPASAGREHDELVFCVLRCQFSDTFR